MSALPNNCPTCGQALPPDSPHGLCPACLLRAAAQDDVSAPTLPSASPLAADAKPVQPTRLPYFGDYELIDEVARGGMGVVYRARQVTLNRIVAVKMILSGEFAGEAEVRRFRVEAEAAANLQHPHIVAIHEIGEHDGRHYFSMDFIAGENLAEHVRRRATPFTAPETARLMKALAGAVHYAHQRGTLHRDLKPQNILIDAQGQPHITDFGLAKQWQPADAADRPAPAADAENERTRTGVVMGSPSYMAPEQAAGRPAEIGPATDVYSLGAILYYLLTGMPPHTGATPLETVTRVVTDDPVAPRKRQPSVPADLETICLKCLEKRPEHRYANARQLEAELQRFLDGEPVQARRPSVSRRTWSWLVRHPWVITSLISCVILALAVSSYGLWETTQRLEWTSRNPGVPLPDVWNMTQGEISKWQWWGTAACMIAALLVRFEYETRKSAAAPIGAGRLVGYLLSILGSLAAIFFLLVKVVKISVWSSVPWHFGPVLIIFLPVFFSMTLMFLWDWICEVQLHVSGATMSSEWVAFQRRLNHAGPFSYPRAMSAHFSAGVEDLRQQTPLTKPLLFTAATTTALALAIGGGNPRTIPAALIGFMLVHTAIGVINPVWAAGTLAKPRRPLSLRLGYFTAGTVMLIYCVMLASTFATSAQVFSVNAFGAAPVGLVGRLALAFWQYRRSRVAA